MKRKKKAVPAQTGDIYDMMLSPLRFNNGAEIAAKYARIAKAEEAAEDVVTAETPANFNEINIATLTEGELPLTVFRPDGYGLDGDL